MERTKESIVFLDTHIVMWLFNGLKDKLNTQVQNLLEKNPIKISPIVLLELEYLYEIKRIKYPAKEVYQSLNWSIELEQSNMFFTDIIEKANSIRWTRDVFDRLIVANALISNAPLITGDRKILKHYKKAVKP